MMAHVKLVVLSVIDYCIDLHFGANLVSFYALPDDVSVGNMMSSLDGVVTGVIGEGVAASPNPVLGWVGSLSNISPTSGYWVKVSEGSQLCLMTLLLLIQLIPHMIYIWSKPYLIPKYR